MQWRTTLRQRAKLHLDYSDDAVVIDLRSQVASFLHECRVRERLLLQSQDEEDCCATDLATFLCGTWVDHRGSVYRVSLGSAYKSLDVHTTRPDGEKFLTRNLIQIVVSCGCEKAMWGKSKRRYALETWSDVTIQWRGAAKRDVYYWRRVDET